MLQKKNHTTNFTVHTLAGKDELGKLRIVHNLKANFPHRVLLRVVPTWLNEAPLRSFSNWFSAASVAFHEL